MKQFFTYVAASVVGVLIVVIITTVLSMIMTTIMFVSFAVGDTPEVKEHSILKIELSGILSERHQGMTLMQQMRGYKDNSKGLDDIVASIKNAANDSKIEGIYLDCKGMDGGTASLEYMRQTLADFKKSGKWIVAYGDDYNQDNYYLASLADSIWLNPMGAVDISGMGGAMVFFKGLLDKIGVEMQVLKVGTYKSAVEPYILDSPSEASVKQTREYITPLWKVVKEGIASSRNVEPSVVDQWADSLIFTDEATTYVGRNIVSELIYRHQAEEKLKQMTGVDAGDDLRFISPENYVKTINSKSSENKIALLYAEGEIFDAGDQGIVSEKMVTTILKLANDDDVDALVLRVNSPGGSAFASEQIWEALQQFKAKGKPFYVSMGDMAASGGYYISCGADKIFCQPTTLTGSIGIFGMIPNIKGLLNNHLGITATMVSTNPNTDLTYLEPMTPFQRSRMQKMIENGYKTFVDRCAQGRHISADSINAIGQGRVWDGTTALNIGLVDQLGNLDQCIETLALDKGWSSYEIAVYPDANKSWWEKILDEELDIQNMLVRNELGEAYPIYKAIQRVKNMNRIQCLAPELIME
ncbi:MAG: signal peptide peptidase SppA [Muribaculum sp.]|nr:signal peptide peptidase SppA [Muribaculaceae bacterium]MCM1080413.1 signal peptide peptidase SppA [Muribaculum sp.]